MMSIFGGILGSLSGVASASRGASAGGGWGSILGGVASSYFNSRGSSGGGQQAGGSNIWGSLLSGLNGAAEGYLTGKDIKEVTAAKGKEDRRTIDFEYQMKDFYDQKSKVRKRAALDTYGQFSLTDRFAPGMIAPPPVEQPVKPGV